MIRLEVFIEPAIMFAKSFNGGEEYESTWDDGYYKRS